MLSYLHSSCKWTILVDMGIFWLYLLTINIIAFLLMKNDKQRAIRRQARISESNLLLFGLLGGSLGEYLGIYAFKHKTRHHKFTYGLPLIMIIQLLFLYWLTIIT